MLAGLLGERHHVSEDVGFVFGENLAGIEGVLAGSSLRHTSDGEHHDIQFAGVGLGEYALQVLEAVGIAHRYQHVPRPYAGALAGDFVARIEAEFLHFVAVERFAFAIGDVGELEDDEEHDGETDAGNRGHLLG